MRASLLVILFLLHFTSFAQRGNRELYLTSGYKNSLGAIGLTYSFLTHSKLPVIDGNLKRYHFRAGFGFDLVHSVRFALGADYDIVHYDIPARDNNRFKPILSLDGIAAFTSTLGDKEGNIWVVKNNFYINPAVGVKYFLKKHFVFRLQAGYSFLFGKPEIDVTYGTMPADKQRDYTRTIEGGPMLLIGAGLYFDNSVNKKTYNAL